MSDDGSEDEQKDQKKFFVDRAKTGRASCKKCKQKLECGELRLAKSGFNPFGPGPMKQWHHVNCMFEVFAKQRSTTAKIETPDDIDGWSDLDEDDQQEILKCLPNCKDWKPASKTPSKDESSKSKAEKKGRTPKDKEEGKSEKEKDITHEKRLHDKEKEHEEISSRDSCHKDDTFREFRRLCASLSDTESNSSKTALVKEWFAKGTDGSSFKGDLHLWCKLLLPGAVKRMYNLESKQLVKLFSKMFHTDQDKMLEDLKHGDVAETIRVFFEKSKHLQPTKKSALTLQDVDSFLEELSGSTKEDEQYSHFKQIVKKCTSNDLKMIVRLVKLDLRIKAEPKHILEAVHPDAYQTFQKSKDLKAALSEVVKKSENDKKENGFNDDADIPEHNEVHKKRPRNLDSEDTPASKKPRVNSHNGSESIEDEKSEEKPEEEEDEFSVFGEYVAYEIRALHSDEKRRALMCLIEKTIIDISEEDNALESIKSEPASPVSIKEVNDIKTEKEVEETESDGNITEKEHIKNEDS